MPSRDIASNREKFLENARSVHGDRYDYSLVVYKNAHTLIKIVCPEHGEFEQKPVVHFNHRAGCPRCNGGVRSVQMEFIDQARTIHKDRYDYSRVVYVNNLKAVKIICPVHGEFEQLPKTHRRGQGCPRCKGGVKLDLSTFVTKAKEFHGDRYDYSRAVYLNNHTPLTIICPVHGEFEQLPGNHINKRLLSGCPECGEQKRASKRRRPREEMIERIRVVHGDRYGFDRFVHTSVGKRVTLTCAEHGDFTKILSNILDGQGCPDCVPAGIHTSSPERFIHTEISKFYSGPIVENDRSLLRPDQSDDGRLGKELDLVFPESKLAIEYCGLRWHGEKHGRKDRRYHLDKLNACHARGYRLITIFEDEFITKPDLVIRRIRTLLGKDTDAVAARKCRVEVIPLELAKSFLDQHHLQGYHGCEIRLGLFFETDLVGVMTFSKPSISKGHTWRTGEYEISRYATSRRVVGGGSKLITAFERQFNPIKIISYCDLRWDTGTIYERMGFVRVRQSTPNYWYFKENRNNKRVHRFALRKTATDDPSRTEWETRQAEGWDRIWDCGNLVFEKTYS